jgi:hypothetical protein
MSKVSLSINCNRWNGSEPLYSSIPHQSNMNGVGTSNLSQHFQGILAHGRFLLMIRTFHTLKNTANLWIHSTLLTLEKVFLMEGSIPDTLFLQIDGGVENTAKISIALCELLVINGLTKKVVLTRLIVGHTHLDIDGVFGKLWTYIRDKHALSPDEYLQLILEALKSYNPEVIDLFAIPNYEEVLTPCIDKNFSRYCKEEQTQHQFIFESVTPSDDFPFGVKMTYRAYSTDETIEIFESEMVLFCKLLLSSSSSLIINGFYYYYLIIIVGFF